MRTPQIAWTLAVAAACVTGAEAPPEYPPLPPGSKPPPAEPAPDPAAEGPTTKPPPPAIDYAAIVAATDRSEADRALDPGRQPAQMLAFFGVTPGMRAGELFSGAGYTAELLARSVGPEGKVFGVNSPWVLERFAEKPWSERLAKPVMKNVVRVDRELDDPLPPEATNLDLVVAVLVYHDFVWQKLDRAALNAAIFRALEPGGTYVIIDHSARDGKGVSEAKTLHRIEEASVRAEVEAAGFELAESADFLRNANDTRDWNASPSAAGERRGQSDRFALRFRKPESARPAP